MTSIHFPVNRQGDIDIRIDDGSRWALKGRIVKKRGRYEARLTRRVSLVELDAIVVYVAGLNEQN